MTTIRLPHNWKPRPYQESLWQYLHSDRTGKRAFEAAHRRWGKDEVGLHYTACAAHERIGSYWHMLPIATQARKAIWEAVNPHTGKRRIDEAFPLEIRDVTRENEMFIRFKCGSTWQVVGSDHYDSLVGTSPAGIVFSEWALSDPRCWAYLRPILAENGGWALFITTPRGRNHAATMYEAARGDPTWFCERKTALDTGVFNQETLDRELAEYQRENGQKIGEALYRQEYLCDFDAPVIGAIYAGLLSEIEAERIVDVPWDPAKKVYTAFDIGRSDAAACWFFQVGPGAIYWIDYHEEIGTDVPYWAKYLESKPYVYEENYFPWDARLSTFASPRSVIQQFHDLKIKAKIVGENDASDRIAAGRIALRRSYFDRKKCQQGLDNLRAYHFKYDDKLKVLSKDPEHDYSSHGSDAFGYAAIAYKEINPLPFKDPTASLKRIPTFAEIERIHDRTSRGERRIA